jgi:uncharacterized protein (DUF2336 family)
MMEFPSAFPGLEDLVDPGQGNQIDMRPTLLRVLTDLYLQRDTHPPEDERYYTELTLRLIAATGCEARAALAERLASYPSAPRAVMERLARDVIEVAAPVLRRSTCLTDCDLAAIAAEFGGAHADIIAERRSTISSAPQPPHSEHCEPKNFCELAELFYAAGPAERRLILINLDYAPITPAQPTACIVRAHTWRLETAALQHNTEAVIHELERALGISRAQARRIIGDESGEPIVVAAKALGLPADVLQRVLLFMNPRIGQSVDRVFALAELYGKVSVDAARRLIAIWRASDKVEGPRAGHEPVPWRMAAENARRALSEVSRRPAQSRDVRLRLRQR